MIDGERVRYESCPASDVDDSLVRLHRRQLDDPRRGATIDAIRPVVVQLRRLLVEVEQQVGEWIGSSLHASSVGYVPHAPVSHNPRRSRSRWKTSPRSKK